VIAELSRRVLDRSRSSRLEAPLNDQHVRTDISV